MAELTGIPQIDVEIARFRAACGTQSVRDPAFAAGACVMVNDAFVRQLHDAGLDACSFDHDRQVVAVVEHEGQRFSVDFSAAQFGTGDAFPLVQRHVAGDVWEREWMSASREAA